MGFDMLIARKFKQLLIDAGFVDVTEEVFEVPWGGWPKDTRLKTIGVWHLGGSSMNTDERSGVCLRWIEQLRMGLQGIAMALLTRSLGWSAAEVEVFLVGLRKELNDKSLHILDHWFVIPFLFSFSEGCSRSALRIATSSTAGNHHPFPYLAVNKPSSFVSGTRQRRKIGVEIG